MFASTSKYYILYIVKQQKSTNISISKGVNRIQFTSFLSWILLEILLVLENTGYV